MPAHRRGRFRLPERNAPATRRRRCERRPLGRDRRRRTDVLKPASIASHRVGIAVVPRSRLRFVMQEADLYSLKFENEV